MGAQGPQVNKGRDTVRFHLSCSEEDRVKMDAFKMALASSSRVDAFLQAIERACEADGELKRRYRSLLRRMEGS